MWGEWVAKAGAFFGLAKTFDVSSIFGGRWRASMD